MKLLCPKCSSRNTYEDGLEMDCMMCGNRWPINGKPSTVIKETIGRKRIMGIKKSPSGKIGICLNCERKKFIAGADGYCSVCHNAVKGMEHGTPDYDNALAEAKRRLTAPVCVSSNKKTEQRKKMISPTEDALGDLYPVVDTLKFRRNFHLAAVEKLTKAIEALES